MLKILNVEPYNYSKQADSLLKSSGIIHKKELSRKALLQQIKNYDILITRFKHAIDKEVILAAPRLKIIAIAATGLDHIDIPAARNQGIEIISLQGQTKFLRNIPSTAEHTWALLLSVVRHLPHSFFSVLRGEWKRDEFIGNELYGKNLGIIGLGRIGRKIARYGLCFGMNIHAYDPFCKKRIKKVRMHNELDEMLPNIDILTIHIPLSQATAHMIGKKEFSLLPKGSIIINTSRGKIIDEKALLKALKSGHLRAAALDVIEACENLKKNTLIAYARHNHNLIITPHIGGATKEAWEKAEVFIAQKIVTKIKRYKKDSIKRKYVSL
jgi:D-3-phosphoglycerate dehydrogenase